MNQSHPIDDLFQGKLKDYEVAPPMHLWDAIDQKRRKPKSGFWWLKKRGLFMGIGFLLLALSGFLLLMPQNQTPESIQFFPVPLVNSEQIANLSKSNQGEENTLSILPSVTEQKENIEVNTSIINPQTQVENNQSLKNNDFSTNILTQTPGVGSTPTLSPQSPSKLNNDQELTDVREPSKNKSLILDYKQKNTTNETSQKIARSDWTEFASISSPLNQSSLSIPVRETEPEWLTAPVFKTGNGISYFMEAFGSPGIASRNIAPVSELFSPLSNDWEASQQNQSAFNFGIRLAMVNRKGWSLKTGIHFTQISESFQFVNHKAETAQIYDPNGGLIREDTIFVPIGSPVNNVNQFSLIDLPLILGYQKRVQKWTLSANAGPVLNLSFQPKGTLINPNRQLVDINSNEGREAFRSQLGINWYGSFGIHYELQPGTHLMLEPYLRFQSRSFMTQNFPVQQKYLTGGVSIGIRKQLLNWSF